MKILFRILIVLSAVVMIYYYSTDSEKQYETFEEQNLSQTIRKTDIPENGSDVLPRPEKGLSTFIDLESHHVTKQFGKPDRVDQTPYGYSWWVYNRKPNTFVMFGVKEDIVAQVYINGKDLDASPYKIGQTLDEVYRMTIVESEVTVEMDDNVYTFAMDENDMRNRILTQFDEIYAQLYIDEVKGVLNGIRYTNGEALVEHQLYEMTFIGKEHPSPNASYLLIEESNRGSANQLNDLINIFRIQHDVKILKKDKSLSEIAMTYSKDLYTNPSLSHEQTYAPLKQRLEEQSIQYEDVRENMTQSYFDAIEAAHGWLNSENHREVLLDESYTHVGSGAFLNCFTQIYIQRVNDKE